jgi:hypothetical protein
MADIYPGWKKFTETLDELKEKVNSEAKRKELAKKLFEALGKVGEKCGCEVKEDDILNALQMPKGRNYDWSIWKGKHGGTFFSKSGNEIKKIDDPQEWESPRGVNIADNPEAVQGVPLNTNCQKQSVVWIGKDGKVKREGWNVSSDKDDYVWGWDPKEETTTDGKKGVHIGFPFQAKDNCDCIVWLTTQYSFVECICKKAVPETGQSGTGGTKPETCRFSVEVGGSYGKWKVT